MKSLINDLLSIFWNSILKVEQTVNQHRIQNYGNDGIEQMQFADQIPIKDGETGPFRIVERK